MKIDSLSYSTLVHQLSYSSQVEDRDQFIVIRTSALPHYYWGNFILFKSDPDSTSFEKWEQLFREEFQGLNCTHMAFAWDSVSGTRGEIGQFMEAGYYFEFDDIVQVSKPKLPNHYDETLEVRPIESNSDWEARIALNVACDPQLGADAIGSLGEHFRADTLKLRGLFMGAFNHGELVGEMALFRGGNGRGLISMVKTHPGYRERGICRTLLYHTVLVGRELFRFDNFVMVADQEGISAKVYKSVGFEVVEHGASLIKRNAAY